MSTEYFKWVTNMKNYNKPIYSSSLAKIGKTSQK